MEREAVHRYNALADVMEMHNNREVTALFRKMAQIEERHAEQIMAEMGWKDAARVPRRATPGPAPRRRRACPRTRCTT